MYVSGARLTRNTEAPDDVPQKRGRGLGDWQGQATSGPPKLRKWGPGIGGPCPGHGAMRCGDLPRTPWSEHQRALGSGTGQRWSSVGKSNDAVWRKVPAPAKRGREYSATAFHYITPARQRYTEILVCYASGFPFASRRSSPVLCPSSSVLSTEPHRPLRPTTANLGHINNLHLRLIINIRL